MEIQSRYVKCRTEKEWQDYMDELKQKCESNNEPIMPSLPCIFVEVKINDVYVAVPVELKQFTEG